MAFGRVRVRCTRAIAFASVRNRRAEATSSAAASAATDDGAMGVSVVMMSSVLLSPFNDAGINKFFVAQAW